jgi:hypothetical protein
MAVLAVLGVLWAPPGAEAQDVAADAALEQPAPAPGLLSAGDLDTLLGPVALYPDTLLTQILLASTYPLEVVKAARFVEDNAETPDRERAALAEQSGWDPSVQALAAGFPSIVTRMNDNLDWTEQVGEALLAQPDDVLNAVQRLRDEAAATGYLTTNDAQTVIVNADDTITIAPTDPQIVYVPTYDPQVVYTQPAPAADVVYVDNGSGTDFGDVLATGAIVFGTAMILDEIFDNDDPWDDYWRGPPRVDWSNNDFHPRPNVNVNGDVNIGNSTINRIDRDVTNIDRGDRVNIGGGDRIDIDRTRIGSADRETIDRNFRPDDAQRAQAREKIGARSAQGGGVATLPATSGPRTEGEGAQARVDAARASGQLKPATVNRPVAANRPAAANRTGAAQQAGKISRPNGAARPAANHAASRTSAFEKSGGARAKAASHRGKASAGNRRR